MMSFLYKVVEDPDLLPRMILQREARNRQPVSDKKPRLMVSSSTSSSSLGVSSSLKSEEEEEGSVGAISSLSPDVDNFCQSSPSPESTHTGQLGDPTYGWAAGLSPVTSVSVVAGIGNGTMAVSPPANAMSGYGAYGGGKAGQLSYFGEMAAGLEASPPSLPYPFSLLGSGF
uniref:Uncharacterized protein MANES_16G116200 n=1 Tax=Rhizophora mucronata TaxID=61149 RepID=A0A2P2NMV5_RHIMU